MPPTTYVALEGAATTHGVRVVLDDVTVGVVEGARIGVVGRNGSGKSTLVQLLAGLREPDRGRVVRLGGLSVGVLAQEDALGPTVTARHHVLGDRADHEWAGDARIRTVVAGLLGDLSAGGLQHGFDTPAETMSGGERRRVALARLLLADPDLLVLDEPTNHLDLEAVQWLADHLAARRGALVAVTHDRWFLDAVATETWEVADATVHRYDGGYAAYVLARAERERRADTAESKRQNLLRKELAWLRRGPPARTSKPRFRIDAANALIADEPPARDRLTLERLATARLGRQVVDLEDVTLAAAPGAAEVLHAQTLRLGPGDRVGLLGPNGVGKTTLLRLLAGGQVDAPDVRGGSLQVGRTVVPALLSQTLSESVGTATVLESTEELRTDVEVGGRTLTARSLLEGFGFSGERLATRVSSLSGGERRRLALLHLLLGGPNLLLLDEPTNDLDVETLTVLEDLLDSWPGTLVVVSHDRYFLERTTDVQYALLGDGAVRHLPGGVEEYLRLRQVQAAPESSTTAPSAPSVTTLTGGEARALRKELASLERRTGKVVARIEELHSQLAENATDHEKVMALNEDLRSAAAELGDLEECWFEIAAQLE